MSTKRSMTAIEKETEQMIVEQEFMVSTEADDLEALPSVSQPVLTQEAVTGPLAIPVLNVVHNVVAESFGKLDDV